MPSLFGKKSLCLQEPLLDDPRIVGASTALRRSAVVLFAGAALMGCSSDDEVPAESPSVEASAESQCNALLGRTFEGATITRARLVAAAPDVPEYCIVRGEMPKDLDFDIRMPTSWNQRTVFRGGGGFDGMLDVGYLSDPVTSPVGSPDLAKRGYATIASNHGHDFQLYPDASFALDTQMLADYAYLSVPRVLASAKAVLRERYGDAFAKTKMVYEGCSGGGRQALIQAQRFPNLFDGVIARAPANAYNPQFLWYQKTAKQQSKPGAALSASKIQAIGEAVYAKCDGLDGLVDRIVARPDACQFDPAELACRGQETDACLTAAQVETARAYYE